MKALGSDNSESLILSCLMPAQQGNTIAALRRAIEALSGLRGRSLSKNRLMHEARKVLSETALTVTERAELEQMLRGYPSLLHCLRQSVRPHAEADQETNAGVLTALLVKGRGRDAHGVCRRIVVSCLMDDKSRLVVVRRERVGKTFLTAIRVAQVAVEHLLTREGLTPRGVRVLAGSSLRVSVEGEDPKEGDSVGLAMALAVLSGLAKVPMPARFAFTGALGIDGTILSVGGLAEKREIARLKEKIAVVPAASRRRGAEENKIEAGSLGQAVDATLGKEVVRKIIRHLNRRGAFLPLGRYQLPLRRGRSADVLLTGVGERDPYPEDKKAGEIEEGAVLTAVRLVRPKWVVLFPTRTPKSSTIKNARYTHNALARLYPGIQVNIQPLVVTDPTDYDQLYAAMRDGVRKAFAETKVDKGSRVSLCISSGTPQMHAAWLLLLLKRVLNAQVLQVRAPKDRHGREERVRVVRSSVLGL